MVNSRNKAGVWCGLVFFALLGATVQAADGESRSMRMAGMFAEELSRNGAVEIKDEQQLCASEQRPLSVSQELAAIMVRAIQYSMHIEINSECRRIDQENEYQDCRFYFYSPNKAEQWSIGLGFLGKPESGKIRLDTLQCFSTP